jgi:hypothetical protein
LAATRGVGEVFSGALAFLLLTQADAFLDRCGENDFVAEHATGAAGHAVGFKAQAVFLVGKKMRAGKAHRKCRASQFEDTP